jgi:SM-20-related protein
MFDDNRRSENDAIFESIANDLSIKGYSVRSNAIPSTLIQSLAKEAFDKPLKYFKKAGIGRQSQHVLDDAIRSDQICWIDNTTEAGNTWLNWADSLKQYLNRRLFLGLNYFESHFAHYDQGSFYKKHKDAFVGQGNRILSIVTYFNERWLPQDGGQLVIYDELGKELKRVLPECGTLVIFLSEEFPHEVLSAQRERYSIAGWFRTGNS